MIQNRVLVPKGINGMNNLIVISLRRFIGKNRTIPIKLM
jgi:hypothetical protein